MKIPFSKYQGAGNDFVIVDDRNQNFPVSNNLIKKLCDRHFGIGADGLMLLSNSTKYDFLMRYFNSDGNESTMCGNGGRCITHFANKIGLIETSTVFEGIDGAHHASIVKKNYIRLKMKDIDSIEMMDDNYFIDSGSPHYINFVRDVDSVDVNREGKLIRQSVNINNGGTNVNFIQVISNDILKIRTFERGVEAETLACGTGAVASSIAYSLYFETESKSIKLIAPGGELFVSFKKENSSSFKDVWLEGPAHHVYNGEIDTSSLLSE
ncbi:MAG: diaminopimelate epimerase [Bacteroidales bacterium]